MPRIRRGGKRIRGSGGGRTRNEECCCDVEIPCEDINDNTWRELREVSVEISGLTIAAGCAWGCATIPLSAILPYDLSVDASAICFNDWGITDDIGCNSCGSGGTSACQYFLIGQLRCFTAGDPDTLRLRVYLHIGSEQFDCADSFGREWAVTWELEMPIGDFVLGDEYELPYVEIQTIGSPICAPSGYTTSVCRMVVT